MSVEKAALRESVMSAASALDGRYIERSNAGIIKRVLSLSEYGKAKRVFAYWSVGREADTHELIARAVSDGKAVALPRTFPHGSMDFAGYAGALGAGRFDIPEPPNEGPAVEPAESDLMLVPALCADERGFRLGRGGGYYDRYLAAHPCFAVCLCREALLQQKLPVEWNDVPVSAVITEERVLFP